MRFLAGTILLAIMAAGCSKAPEPRSSPPAESPALLFHYHFIGTAAVAAETNASKLANIWALPATHAFAGATFDKLANSLPALWNAPGVTNAPGNAAALRPLLEELVQVESCGELRSASNESMTLLLAARLPEDRAGAWSATLEQFATNGTGRATSQLAKAGGGWRAAKPNSRSVFQFLRAGDWIVMGFGVQTDFAAFDAAVERGAKKQLPLEGAREGWLRATIDLPRLAKLAGFESPVRLGMVELNGFGRDENVRFEGRILYESPLHLSLTDWQIPTNSVFDPLTSFTAIRGLEGLLTRTNWAQDWSFTNVPNQFQSWAQADLPYQLYWAMPLPGPTNLLAMLEPKLSAISRSNLIPRVMTTVKYDPAEAVLRAELLPPVVPFLVTLQQNHHAFLHGGLTPPFTNATQAPRELYAAFQSRTNLIYYDWEITENRLLSLRNLTQLFCLLTGRHQSPLPPDEQPGWRWIPEIASRLGETVTTVNVHSPTELQFTRRGHLGLTGAEITLLVRMLDAKGFPFAPFDWFERDPAAFAARPPARPQTNSPAKGP